MFACFWFGGAAVMSRIAGWHALGALYPAPLRVRGEELRFCTAALGTAHFPITYRRCVRVLLTEQGIGLCLMFPFRFHSPPFLVPWTSVVACDEKQVLATRKVTLSFAGSDRRVTFAGPLGQLVKSTWRTAVAPAQLQGQAA